MKHIDAGGLDVAYLEQGEGPLVLLLHGFPDTAHTWDATLPRLAEAGYRAVAPNLRGYAPTAIPDDGDYSVEALARDASALIAALGEEDAAVVGHDWGAATSYALAGEHPEQVRQLITLAIPHPAAVKPSPRLAWRARHFADFKLPGALWRLRRKDYALVDALVKRWSPAWRVPPGETDAVKEAFRQPGSDAAALAYYKQMPLKPPRALTRRIAVPTVAFAGEDDGALPVTEPYEASKRYFDGPYRWEAMPGGHFLHREHPGRFHDALLEALENPAST